MVFGCCSIGWSGCDPWALDDHSSTSPAGGLCQSSGDDGTGGDDGAGGSDGVGGALDDGTGAGAGSSSADVGAGAGSSSAGAGAGPGEGARAPHPRPRRVRRHTRGGAVGGPGPTPQDYPCSTGTDGTGQIAPQSPCNEQCLADYDAAATVCGKIASDADRKTCQDNAYAVYQQCRAACAGEPSPTSPTSKECDDKYQNCIDKGPASCLKNSGGKTLCQRCWERCNAGDSPSSACTACYF